MNSRTQPLPQLASLAMLALSIGCLQDASPQGTTGGATTCTATSCGAHAACGSAGICECYVGWTKCEADGGGLACVDVELDDDNCGTCGAGCGCGEVCLGGVCNCQLDSCTNDAGVTTCSDLQIDPHNCGICSQPCGSEEVCTLVRFPQCSSCQPPTVICKPDSGYNFCADIETDPYNCGACGIVCDSGICLATDAGTGICE